MRLLGRPPLAALLVTSLVVPTAVLAPALSSSAPPAARPVSPNVQTVPLHGVDQAVLRTTQVPQAAVKALMDSSNRSEGVASRELSRRAPVVLTKPMATHEYRMLAVTWDANSAPRAAVSVRTHTDGAWGKWTAVKLMDDLANGPPPNGRFGTQPYWTGSADGVQVRVDAVGSGTPRDVQVNLIEPGTSPADAAITDPPPAGSAYADDSTPNIVTRAEWGADESLRDKHMEMSDTVKVAFVHHTAGTNDYGPNDGPAVVRGLYSYYIYSLGYADIGYNFLVDKYGHVYEGRAGSITTPVRQAATGGFNKDTMSVVALGNFETAKATDALVDGISRILAFRLSSYHLDPLGRQRLQAETGSSRYAAGQWANFRVISGHRDAGYTACPGQHLYDRMGDIRKRTFRDMGANLVHPSVSQRTFHVGEKVAATVTSGVLRDQNWTLTVSQACTGDVVRTIKGSATPNAPIQLTWSGNDDERNAVPPGRYRLTLTSSDGDSHSWPWSTRVTVGVGGATRPVHTVALPPVTGGTYIPVTPTVVANTVTGLGVSQPLVLGQQARVGIPVLGQAGVPTSGVSAVAVSVVASCGGRQTDITAAPRGSTAGTRVVSLAPNTTARGLGLVRVGANGQIQLRNQAGSVALSVSIVGYVSSTGGGGSLVPLRRRTLPAADPLAVTTKPTSVPVGGQVGVPTDARAVVLNIRRSADSPVSTLWAWPTGSARPGPSSWRQESGRPASGRVIVPLGPNGAINIAGDKAGSVDADVVGYVADNRDRLLSAVTPIPVRAPGHTLAADGTETVRVRGQAGVPTTARAVVLQVSGLDARRNARLTVWPRGKTRPTLDDLVVPEDQDRDGLLLVPIGDHGDIKVHAEGGPVGVKIVTVGWIS